MPTLESPKTEHAPTNTNGAASRQLSYAMTQFLQERDQRKAFFAEGDPTRGDERQRKSVQTEKAKGKGDSGRPQTNGQSNN